MLFNSYIFIFLFLPIALAGYYGFSYFKLYRVSNIFLIRNFLNLGIIESRNYIRISYGSFLYAGTNGISPFS